MGNLLACLLGLEHPLDRAVALLRSSRIAPLSVDQMPITLERQGLIRRHRGVAGGRELLIDPVFTLFGVCSSCTRSCIYCKARSLARMASLAGHERPGFYAVRRSRFALALARFTKGASTAAWPRPDIIAAIEDRIAAAFSPPIRQYSAVVHVPCAIKRLRRAMVSHDAAVSMTIVTGSI
jgi:hypothetical protein